MPLATLHHDLPDVEHGMHQAIGECESAENALGIDEKNALVDRVASSRNFAKAPKLQHFLRYIADHTFAGKTDLITETRIGIEVFKRKDTYHPGEDNIVRSYARTLRKRLDEYFVTEGKEEEYLLRVPRGGYALVVARRPEHQSLPENSNREHAESPLCAPAPTAVGTARVKRLWIPAVLLSTLLCSLLLGAYRMGRRAAVRSSSFNVHRFWAAFLSDRETLIVPSDTGLTMILGLTEQDVSIQQYVTNQHLKTLAEKYPQLTGWDRPISHRYSDFVDVEAVHQFDQTPEISGHSVDIQYARDLRAASFQSRNVILLGGHNANPWVDLYDAKLNFNLHFDAEKRTFQVINRRPLPGEPAVYPYQTGGMQPYAYGILAITPNETNTGNVLLLEGVTNSGLQAVVATLADETLMATIAGIVVRPDHSIQPAEFLIRTVGVGGESMRPEILGQRVDGTPGH